MSKKLIRNEVVSMDWDAEGFFESKKLGFIAATQIYHSNRYGDVVVVFHNFKAFTLLNEEEKPACRDDIRDAFKEYLNYNEPVESLFEDSYVEFCSQYLFDDDLIELYGFSDEVVADIEARLKDLSGYWATVTEDYV